MTARRGSLAHLDLLESEALHVIREIVAERERPVLLFSGGKDSIVLLHLARKAFHPARLPFPVLHVDTGHNFAEVLECRDALVKDFDLDLRIASVPDAIARGRVVDETGLGASRNRLQIPVLLDALAEGRFDAAFGGARRDEERARAKERFVSHRDRFGQWDPKNQRPELFNLYQSRIGKGEHVRVFPLSNFTELDIWLYIRREGLRLPRLYFAHGRPVLERDGLLLAMSPVLERAPHETPFDARVRFRTVGDATCTGCVMSGADTIDAVIAEVITSTRTERGVGRADDLASAAAMEERKREGYF